MDHCRPRAIGRLRHTALPQPGCAASCRRRRFHRCREIYAGQRPGGISRHTIRGNQAHNPATHPPAPPGGCRMVRRQPDPSRTRAHPRHCSRTPGPRQPGWGGSGCLRDDVLVLLEQEQVPQGMALLDAPDVDSISDENRRLAGQLLAAADLWVFVTTANRYADAVPWRLLLDAASRDITVAVVLDRVPPEAEAEVREDLQAMLTAQGLGGATLFVIHEYPLDAMGMLPAGSVDSLRSWLQGLAADAGERSAVARRTLNGAVKAVGARMEAIAGFADAQAAARELRDGADAEYSEALKRILDATKDGALLRGEVLTRRRTLLAQVNFSVLWNRTSAGSGTA